MRDSQDGVAGDLELRDIRVTFGKAVAVDMTGQVLEAPAGALTLLLGANGAGKSSLLNGAYGAVRSAGKVAIGEVDLSSESALGRAKAGMALVPQGRQLFPRMTVRENLMVMAELLRLPAETVDRGIERFEPLKRGERKSAGVLSGGEQQMLAISRALLAEPRVLLLDELSTGLAPVIVSQLLEHIAELAESGVAALLASPTSSGLLRHVTGGYVMVRGSLIAGPIAGSDLDAAYADALGNVRRHVDQGVEQQEGTVRRP